MRLAYRSPSGFRCCLCDYNTDLELDLGHQDIMRHLRERHQRYLVQYSDVRNRRDYNGPAFGWVDQLPEEIRK